MGPAATQPAALVRDAFETVLAWPEHAPSWWHLASCLHHLAPDEKGIFLDALRSASFATAQAQWFQQSALHDATGDPRALGRQAELAARLPGADRWMALANVAWWSALSRAADRAAFRQVLLDARLPWLLETLGRDIPPGAASRKPRRELQRVAIVAQHLAIGVHAPTALTFDMRAVLERAGIATRVFAAQDLDLPAMKGHTSGGYLSNVAPADPASWQLRMPGTVAVTMADTRFSPASRWAALVRLVDEYDPDVVLFVGLFSPLLWPLYRRHPVLGLSVHTVPPLGPVDAWLAADAAADETVPWPGLPRPMPARFPYRFWPAPRQAVSRSEAGVPDEAVLLVTSGARLDPLELAPWIDGIAAIVGERPGVHWLLVGVDAAAADALAARHARVHALPHRTDLAGWIAASQICLNPPRLGGGATVAMAMQFGVPVVSMAGSDGGDKIGMAAVDSADAYRARLVEWLADPQARAREGRRLQARFADELDVSSPAASAALVRACEQAQSSFRQRLRTPATACCVDEHR